MATNITVKEFHFESEHIVADRGMATAALCPVDQSIEYALQGKMPGVEREVILPNREGGSLSVTFNHFFPPHISSGPRSPTLIVIGETVHDPNALSDLDWELRSATVPFHSLKDLCDECGLQGEFQYGNSAMLQLIAEAPGHISEQSGFDNGEVRIGCVVGKDTDPTRWRAGYRIWDRNGVIHRGSCEGSEWEWTIDGEGRQGMSYIPVKGALMAQVYLSYCGIGLHEFKFADLTGSANVRYKVYEAVATDVAVLESLLLQDNGAKKNDAREFEAGVALLLGFLGFSLLPFTMSRVIRDAPDLVALSDNGNILAVECTTGPLDNKGKFGKLAQRALDIRKKLEASGSGVPEIQMVLVSMVSREGAVGDRENAGKANIAVLCAEDIQELLEGAPSVPDSNRVFDHIKACIPDTQASISAGIRSLFRNRNDAF
ncbi:hypothetical protein A9R16_008185 [Acidiferrobacter thiooxydans]|uniref:hypothetical protein n=1 Tax=Acidiferrobacter thiooxydans TaxID=163359 RepID=UPI00114767EA|nr:hypothetical protein [Acidiferrobacter thiooxydans]UEN98425.1 hypothetical protein A9R16_008185 [Acidiferrobacter thiooxydans]